MAVKRSNKKQKRKQNLTRMTLLAVVLFLIVGMGFAMKNLSDKAASYAAREAELESLIAAEEGRAYEYKEMSKLRQTLRYIEILAREKLNLVFPDEILVKPEE